MTRDKKGKTNGKQKNVRTLRWYLSKGLLEHCIKRSIQILFVHICFRLTLGKIPGQLSVY